MCRRTLRAEELAGDVEGLAADDNNLLASKELLSNGGSQATEEVALAIDDDLRMSVSSMFVSGRSSNLLGE